MPAVKKNKTENFKVKVKKSKPAIEDEVKSDVVSSQLEKKIKNKKAKKSYVHKSTKGVVLIKRIPHGFYEDQVRQYFEQFGNVSRVRVARSRKSGRSKGFAFIEYTVPEVAEIAAETMNNYIMFKQNLQAVYIPPEEQKYNYFKSTVKVNELGFTSSLKGKKFRSIKNHNANVENVQNLTKRNEKKLKYLKKKYEELGIVIDPTVLSSPKSLAPVKKAPAGKVNKPESSDEDFESDESFEFEDIKLGSDDEEDDKEIEPTKTVAKSSKRIAQKLEPKTKKAAVTKKPVTKSESVTPVASKKKSVAVKANKKVAKKVVQEESPVAVKKAKKVSTENLLKPKRAGIEKKKKVDGKNLKVETDKLKFAVKKMLNGDSPKKVNKGKDALKKKAGKK